MVCYDNLGQFVPQASVPNGGTITAVLPLPHFRATTDQAATSVEDGKVLYEAHDYDVAQRLFQKALAADPQNLAAEHYLELIQEKKSLESAAANKTASNTAMAQVEPAWQTPQRARKVEFTGSNPYSHQTNAPGATAVEFSQNASATAPAAVAPGSNKVTSVNVVGYVTTTVTNAMFATANPLAVATPAAPSGPPIAIDQDAPVSQQPLPPLEPQPETLVSENAFSTF